MQAAESAGIRPVCRGCGAADLADLGACAPYPERLSDQDAGRLLRCRRCALAQRAPCLDAEALTEAYRATPAEDMDYRFEDNAAWFGARVELLRRFAVQDSPAILDVGCHTGAFLAALPKAWIRHGIESAIDPVRVASERHGVKIIGERLDAIDGQWQGRFDAVTMFDVVEHLIEPEEGIAAAARLLRPGGVLILSSGDFDAWTWRWMGGGHWYLQTPLHLSVISEPFLRHAAGRSSLRLVRIRRLPHRRMPMGERFGEALKALYWGLRRRQGWYRIPHKLMQSLPGLRSFRHMRNAPWTMGLKDHLLATYER